MGPYTRFCSTRPVLGIENLKHGLRGVFLKTSSTCQAGGGFRIGSALFFDVWRWASDCIAAGSLPSEDHPPFQPRCLDSLTSHESLVAILLHQLASFNIMSETLPLTVTTPLQFENGIATGFSHRWRGGQYCTILTEAGIVGCGIYDVKTAGEFGQAIAIAKGTPEQPLVTPEDLYDAKIVDMTPAAKDFGITLGMTGREATECLLRATLSTNP